MSCLYTGAVVLFNEYGAAAPADLYGVGDIIVIRWSQHGLVYNADPANCTHAVDVSRGWHREDIGVTVVPRGDFTFGDPVRK